MKNMKKMIATLAVVVSSVGLMGVTPKTLADQQAKKSMQVINYTNPCAEGCHIGKQY